jgi:hypothetical protein
MLLQTELQSMKISRRTDPILISNYVIFTARSVRVAQQVDHTSVCEGLSVLENLIFICAE